MVQNRYKKTDIARHFNISRESVYQYISKSNVTKSGGLAL